MKHYIIIICSVILLSLSACSTGSLGPHGPFEGVSANSYGPMTDYVDSTTQKSITPPSCDPNKPYSDINELSRQMTALIAEPIAGMEQIDPSLKLEDLQGQFKIPGDVGTYYVTLLERDHDHIVFWYDADMVTLPETYKAACIYCSRFNRQAVYLGSARSAARNSVYQSI